MGARVLVMGAGTAAAENFISSLRVGDPSLVPLGCNDDRFVLKHSSAAARYLIPSVRAPSFGRDLEDWIGARKIDLIVPTADSHVQALGNARGRLPGKIFLPSQATIALCQDKYELTRILRQHGLPSPRTYPVTRLTAIDGIFGRLGKRGPLWCRPRTGTCARGGAAVTSPKQARSWIRLWEAMQSVPRRSFTLCEYLPGREVLCQSLWSEGRMVLANTFERLSLFGVDNIPSGVTSLSSLAKTVHQPEVVELCREAIRQVAPGTSGAFSIDTKEDARGRPHITEINVGRFFMAMTAFDRVLKHNMVLAYVRLGLGEPVDLDEEYDTVDGYYMVRDMDMHPGIYHADDLFEGVEEAPV